MKGQAGRWVAALKHRPFIVCVVLLTAATISTGRMTKWMKVALRKEAVPLRKPLTELNRQALGEYEFAQATLLDPATVSALGTEEYIDWEFRDTSVTYRNDPLLFVRALITYYTGKPNLVPHTAEVCWSATGFEIVEKGSVTLNMAGAGHAPMEIPARAVTFEKSAVYDHDRPTVIYTFHCNGEFLAERSLVRARLANPFDKGAYFCKVEVSFHGQRTKARSAGREETIQAAQKFLSRLLPALLDEHLPDWEAVCQNEGTVS